MNLPFVVVSSLNHSLSRIWTSAVLSIVMATIATVKKRRGVARASLTRLTNRIQDIERESGEPKTLELAQRMSQKLTDLDAEFRSHHHALIDLIEDDDALSREQETLDAHDDLVAELSVRIKRVIATSSPSMNESARRIASRKLAHLQKSLDSIDSVVNDTSKAITDMCLYQQYEERVVDINRELAKTRDDLHRMELDETDKLLEHQDQLESQVFNCSVKIKKLISSIPAPSETSTSLLSESKGVKLPKLNVPTFDGNILNWRSFWE